MKEEKKKTFAEFFRGSLKGHIVGFQVFGAFPYFLFFLCMDYLGGVDLSLSRLLRLIASSVGFGLLSAVLIWYFLTRILKRKYKF